MRSGNLFFNSVPSRESCKLTICTNHTLVMIYGVDELFHSSCGVLGRSFPRHRDDTMARCVRNSGSTSQDSFSAFVEPEVGRHIGNVLVLSLKCGGFGSLAKHTVFTPRLHRYERQHMPPTLEITERARSKHYLNCDWLHGFRPFFPAGCHLCATLCFFVCSSSTHLKHRRH